MKTVRAYPLLGFAPDRLATARHAPVYRKLITHLTHHGPLKWLGTPRMLPMNVFMLPMNAKGPCGPFAEQRLPICMPLLVLPGSGSRVQDFGIDGFDCL